MRSTVCAAVILVLSVVRLSAGEGASGKPLGNEDFQPTPEQPVGRLGDWTGRYPGAHDFVLEWDSTTGKNILWKTELPTWGGHSSPIVVGKRVFLTCEPNMTVCLDAETGAILWTKEADGVSGGGSVKGGSSGTYHHSCGWSMGTVARDGRAVYVSHNSGVVVSYDLEGMVRWRVENPPLGWSASSPVLIDGRFLLRQGSGAKVGPPRGGPHELMAYACEDGALAWRNPKAVKGSWNAPRMAPLWVGGVPFVVNHCGFQPHPQNLWVIGGSGSAPS